MKMRRRAADCDDSIDPEAREWPHLAVDVQDPKACLAQCRQRFVSEVVLTPDDDTPALCEALNRTAGADEDLGLGWLYCCSSVLCGVSFDRETRSAGQDPNVNGIVNECRNLDYKSVVDPGVPPDDFTCPESSVYAAGETRACVNFVGSTDLRSSASSFYSSSSLEASSTPTTPSESSVSQSDPTPDADLTRSQDSSSAPSQDGLATGVKAAIGVLSFLAFLALLSILLCLLRRRYPSRTRQRSVRDHTKHAHSPPSSSSSPSRLVPTSAASSRPNTSAALSPPLRLKDRRLLPTLMGGASSRNPLPRAAFPTSPICAPTTSKLVPRNENAPLPPFSPTPKPRSSTSSGSSISRASLRASTDPPSRPPRPHDAPLEIPDLVAPAGPPPDRALPPTPPTAGPKTDIGVAISRNSGVPERSRGSVDESGRARASWGSWGTRVVSPVLGEDELERMGGKYT